jgi:hypothetical protein
LFQNIAFPIENRPGIESQSIEKAIDLLAPVLKTDGVQMDEMQRALAEGVLSDWHLVFFLAQCGMFEEVRSFAGRLSDADCCSQAQAKLIARVAVAHETGDHAALDELVKTDAWKTLVTIARDQANSKSKSTPRIQDNIADFSQVRDRLYPTTGLRRSRRICWRRSTVSLDPAREMQGMRVRRRLRAKRSARIALMSMPLARRIATCVGCP